MPQTTDPQQVFAALFEKKAGIKLGLDRVREGATNLGLDLRRPGRILIAGTNGKGTTAGYLWQLLTLSGYRVGLFTSPHLIHFRERIFLPEGPVTDRRLLDVLEAVTSGLGEDLFNSLSFFEINTLLALKVFADAELDFEILEVGLGGRLDATNICESDAAVIVSVGHDHQEFLGDTLKEIAGEKAGIIKSSAPVFFGEPNNTIAAQVVTERAQRFDAPLTIAKGAESSGKDSLPGYLQRNFQLAKEVAASLKETVKKEVRSLTLDEVSRKAATGEVPVPPSLVGRFQVFSDPPYLLDVCHNPEAVGAFVQALRERNQGQKVPGLVSILRDKPFVEILGQLKEVLSPIYGFGIQDPRSWQREDPPEALLHSWYGSFAEAKDTIRSTYPNTEIAVCGSVRAMGDVLSCLGDPFS